MLYEVGANDTLENGLRFIARARTMVCSFQPPSKMVHVLMSLIMRDIRGMKWGMIRWLTEDPYLML